MAERLTKLRPIPASCAGLELKRVYLELVRMAGNISAAARRLDVPVHDLRIMTRVHPELIDAALEAQEQALDKAERIVMGALDGDDMAKRLEAAKTILRLSPAARKRGWGRPKAQSQEADEPPRITLKWRD